MNDRDHSAKTIVTALQSAQYVELQTDPAHALLELPDGNFDLLIVSLNLENADGYARICDAQKSQRRADAAHADKRLSVTPNATQESPPRPSPCRDATRDQRLQISFGLAPRSDSLACVEAFLWTRLDVSVVHAKLSGSPV